MARAVRFRTNPAAVVMWGVAHAALWSFLAVAFGLVDFLDAWRAALLGGFVGIGHSTLQWSTTSLSVVDGTLVSRNFTWVQRVRINEIEVIQRARHRRWSGVIVRTRDGQEVVLAAPVSSVLSPNPQFDEEVHRLCANIALGDSVFDDDDDDDAYDEEFNDPDEPWWGPTDR